MKNKDSQFPTVKCYDNGGKTADRYTAVFLKTKQPNGIFYDCVGMSANPFHPQGVGQHTTCQLGKHLGKRIDSKDLPIDCQKLIKSDLTLR